MMTEFNEHLRNKEKQRNLITRSVEEYLSKGGVISQLPALDDKTSASLLKNLESHVEFQHLDSNTLAKSAKGDDGLGG